MYRYSSLIICGAGQREREREGGEREREKWCPSMQTHLHNAALDYVALRVD